MQRREHASLSCMHVNGGAVQAIHLRKQRHVGALRRHRRVDQGKGETAQLRPSGHSQARLRIKHLLSRVHSVGSRPGQSLRDTHSSKVKVLHGDKRGSPPTTSATSATITTSTVFSDVGVEETHRFQGAKSQQQRVFQAISEVALNLGQQCV